MVPILFLYTFTLFLHTIVIMVGTGDRIPKLKVKKIDFESKVGEFCTCMSSQRHLIDIKSLTCMLMYVPDIILVMEV